MKILLFAFILFFLCSDQPLSGFANGSESTSKQQSLELPEGLVEANQLMSFDEMRRLTEEDSGEKQLANDVERKASGGGAHRGNGVYGGGNIAHRPKGGRSSAPSSSISTTMLYVTINLLLGTLLFMF